MSLIWIFVITPLRRLPLRGICDFYCADWSRRGENDATTAAFDNFVDNHLGLLLSLERERVEQYEYLH